MLFMRINDMSFIDIKLQNLQKLIQEHYGGYKGGERKINIFSFNKLMQFYEVGGISDFLMKRSLIKNEKYNS